MERRRCDMKTINNCMALNPQNKFANKLNCFGESKNMCVKNKRDTYYEYENELIKHFIRKNLI
jgi:hypothetical protein